jgi:hypothetical protein
MKKLNQSKSIVVFLLLLFITSCSTDSNELSQNAVDKESRIIKNIETLSSFIIESNVDIQEKLAKNGKLAFDEKFTIALNSSKNETDIKKAFEMAGIKDSDAIMSMLKEQINVKKQFVKDNPDFYKLNIDKRNTLFNKSFDAAVTNLSNPFRTQTLKVNSFGTADKYAYQNDSPGDCIRVYNRQIGRCNRDYAWCGGFAVLGAGFTGGLGGLLGAAYCMTSQYYCNDDAKQDLYYCIYK